MSISKLEKQPSVGSSILDRTPARLVTKKNVVRPDSPTTQQACYDLGINVNELHQKTLEDFQDPKEDSDIIELRFNHYIRRYKETLKAVAVQRRKLLKRAQQNLTVSQHVSPSALSFNQLGQSGQGFSPTKLQIPPTQNNLTTNYGKFNTSTTRKNGRANSYEDEKQGSQRRGDIKTHFLSPQPGLHHDLSSPNSSFFRAKNNTSTSFVGEPVLSQYKQMMSYVKKAHHSPDVQDSFQFLDETLNSDDYDTRKMGEALAVEIEKFNKAKRAKQREALELYEAELKRADMVRSIEEKQKRKENLQKKMIQDKKKVEEEKKDKVEEKLERLKYARYSQKEKRLKKLETIKAKEEKAKKVLEQEQEEKKLALEQQALRIQEAQKKAEERRKLKEIQDLEEAQHLKTFIDAKMKMSNDVLKQNQEDKKQKIREQIQRIEDGVKKSRLKQKHDYDNYMQKVVESFVQKEEQNQKHQKQLMKQKKDNLEKLKEKNKRFREHKTTIADDRQEKMDNLMARLERSQQNLQHQKELREKHSKQKQEEIKLKFEDQKDNFSRLQKQMDHHMDELILKDRIRGDKVAQHKAQLEFLKKAKFDFAIETKIERDRLDTSVMNMSKHMYKSSSTMSLQSPHMKMLKNIIAPTDYQTIKDEIERKQEAKELSSQSSLNPGNWRSSTLASSGLQTLKGAGSPHARNKPYRFGH